MRLRRFAVNHKPLAAVYIAAVYIAAGCILLLDGSRQSGRLTCSGVQYTVLAVKRLDLSNPDSRFQRHAVEYFDRQPTHLELFQDESRTIVSKNDSPDLDFRYSVNPYRGCMHGCAYCYARPSHEYLDFGAGTDFERKIVLKRNAAQLLRRFFQARSWRGAPIVFSGNTDCYQPIEATEKLTRDCLRVCEEYRNPVFIITKSALVERDIELLSSLAQHTGIGVAISIPFWDAPMARAIEPYAPTPQRRIATIERLRSAGIDVTVAIAPVIPGLADDQLVDILRAAAAAGAQRAFMTYLRLPGSVSEVFFQRLREYAPDRVAKVQARVREAQGVSGSHPRFGVRMVGQGPYAEAVRSLFQNTARAVGLETGGNKLWRGFRRPEASPA